MLRSSLYRAITGLITILATAAVAGSAYAADGTNITASPTTVQQAVDPGASVTGSLSAIDDSDQTTQFTIYATPYGVTGEDYQQSFEPQAGFGDASKWFKFDFTAATLAPHGQLQVPYKLTVPAGTAPGGYYAAVFFQTKPVPNASSGVNVQRRVGVIFYIRVNGAVSQAGRIASWDVPFWQTQAPLATDVRLENSGNIYYQADVTMRVKDLFGGTKFTTETTRYVLPKTIRKIPLDWPGAPKFGLYRVSGTAVFLGQTETLPGHLVLVMSQLAFIEVVLVVLILAVLITWVWRRARR